MRQHSHCVHLSQVGKFIVWRFSLTSQASEPWGRMCIGYARGAAEQCKRAAAVRMVWTQSLFEIMLHENIRLYIGIAILSLLDTDSKSTLFVYVMLAYCPALHHARCFFFGVHNHSPYSCKGISHFPGCRTWHVSQVGQTAASAGSKRRIRKPESAPKHFQTDSSFVHPSLSHTLTDTTGIHSYC